MGLNALPGDLETVASDAAEFLVVAESLRKYADLDDSIWREGTFKTAYDFLVSSAAILAGAVSDKISNRPEDPLSKNLLSSHFVIEDVE